MKQKTIDPTCRVFKKTADDWHPSYKLNGWHNGIEGQTLVEVSFLKLGNSPDPAGKLKWRVCVWGADDDGRDNDFEKKEDAWECFIKVIQLPFVSKQTLKEMGFINA